MEFLKYLVPLLVFSFLIFRLRKSPLVACVAPLALTMGESIFFKTWGVTFSLPGFPVPLVWSDIVLVSLMVAQAWMRLKRPQGRRLNLGLDMIVVVIFLGLVIWQVPLAWLKDDKVSVGIIFMIRPFLYLPLGVLVWVDILRRATYKELEQVIKALAFVTVPLAGLYTISSLGLAQIYTDSAYYQGIYGSATILRDALSFPFYANIALAYFLIRPKGLLVNMISIGVLFSSVLGSYTRSLILPAGLMAAIAIIYWIFVRQKIGFSLLQVGFLLGVGVILLTVAFTFLPDNAQYLMNRLQEAQSAGLNTNTVQTRAATLAVVERYLYTDDPIFGAGFSNSTGGDLEVLFRRRILGDSLWLILLLWLGWSGVVTFAGILLVMTLLSLRSMWNHREPERLALGAILFMVVCWNALRTFISDDGHIHPIGLAFIFALVVAEGHSLWVKNP